jgi:2,4-dienoyl-CoA reductase-like NADH-dependent reductase (Old Yellow Enzyme family)
LFAPFVSPKLSLPNRIVMAPMTRSKSPGGVPGADVAAYYRRRAEHGVGLIVTEGTAIDHPAAVMNPNIPWFHGDAPLAGWARVVSEVHRAGGRIVPQLWHVGMSRKVGAEPNPDARPVGPSGLVKPGELVNEPMSGQEIAEVIAGYARSAAQARRLGFDGLELHAAHGYLIDQFLWGGTNLRDDRYGGDLTRRTQFGVDVVRACRAEVGGDFPIIFRFSQWKIQDYGARLATTPDELAALLSPLVDAGVDIFHCSTRRFWQPEFDGSTLNLAGWTKKLTGLPVITVGSVGLSEEFMASLREAKSAETEGLDALIGMVERQEVDLVAIGRALLVDAAWAEKVRAGRSEELVPFTPEALKTLS